MVDLAQTDVAQDASGQALSPLQAKAEAYRFALAGTLRSLAAVSNATATNLETHGHLAEVMALIATLDRLRAQTGDQFECFGAALGSCGSA
ncbi:hypothetical protein MKK63_21050 [Methylobacterium sp. J-088]|uniref:hypothetical protein n=1 Tax=Methylobacterium sp. J-088 TaxID=2836664 RepID=UPI001FBBE138|nr:hypothetical protein [Methylobacterium sp. J-088]MCJ2065182.1 hypothetical protein [Methylobacterium sp. J-088]